MDYGTQVWTGKYILSWAFWYTFHFIIHLSYISFIWMLLLCYFLTCKYNITGMEFNEDIKWLIPQIICITSFTINKLLCINKYFCRRKQNKANRGNNQTFFRRKVFRTLGGKKRKILGLETKSLNMFFRTSE